MCTCCYARWAENVGTSGRDICGCCYSPTSNTVTPTHKDTAPGDKAGLPDGNGGAAEDANASGMLWDDPDFPTPSSITLPVSGKTFTGIQWLRPPVSAACIITITSGQRILTKGRIAVLSPIAAVNGFVRPWPSSNTCFFGPAHTNQPPNRHLHRFNIFSYTAVELPMCFNRADNLKNCPFFYRDPNLHLIHGFLGPPDSPLSQRHLDIGSAVSRGSRTFSSVCLIFCFWFVR